MLSLQFVYSIEIPLKFRHFVERLLRKYSDDTTSDNHDLETCVSASTTSNKQLRKLITRHLSSSQVERLIRALHNRSLGLVCGRPSRDEEDETAKTLTIQAIQPGMSEETSETAAQVQPASVVVSNERPIAYPYDSLRPDGYSHGLYENPAMRKWHEDQRRLCAMNAAISAAVQACVYEPSTSVLTTGDGELADQKSSNSENKNEADDDDLSDDNADKLDFTSDFSELSQYEVFEDDPEDEAQREDENCAPQSEKKSSLAGKS